MFRLLAAVVIVCAVMVGVAQGDEVLFKNGDKLTGAITSADGGKLKIKTAVAGEVTVDLKDVKSFSTDGPIQIQLDDGSVLRQRVRADEEGRIALQPEGPLAAQAIPLTQVKKINPPPAKWTGSIVANALWTDGNSNNTSLALSLDASRRTEQDRLTLGAGYFFAQQKDRDTGVKSTTADNWFALGKYDYFLSEKWYLFAQTRVERDRIANLDLRLVPSAGAGYQWVERPDFSFLTEGGLAWVYEKYEDAGSESHLAARLAYRVSKQLNDKVSVFHSLTWLPSLENLSDYNIIADAGVRSQLSKSFFTELKLEYNYDSSPAPGAERDDLRLLAGVGWQF